MALPKKSHRNNQHIHSQQRLIYTRVIYQLRAQTGAVRWAGVWWRAVGADVDGKGKTTEEERGKGQSVKEMTCVVFFSFFPFFHKPSTFHWASARICGSADVSNGRIFHWECVKESWIPQNTQFLCKGMSLPQWKKWIRRKNVRLLTLGDSSATCIYALL